MQQEGNLDTLFALSQDMELCDRQVRDNNLDSAMLGFWRRAFIRCAFALIEGFAFLLRQKSIEFLRANFHAKGLNVTTLALLLEQNFTVDDTGKIKEIAPLRLPFKNYLAFTIRTFADEVGVTHNFFGDNGWCELQKAIRVRDRLMHPKLAADAQVEDHEVESTREGLRWFQNAVVDILNNTALSRGSSSPPRR